MAAHEYLQKKAIIPNSSAAHIFRQRPPLTQSSLLPSSLTVNGETQSAFFRYEGRDANASAGWLARVGTHATLIGTGGDPTYGVSGPGPAELSQRIDFVGGTGKCFQVDSSSACEITTEDIVLEIVFRVAATVSATSKVIEKRVGGTGPGGWSWVLLGTRQLYFQLYPGAIAAFQSDVLTAGTDYHAIGFADRSGSGLWYVQGAAATATGISGASASLTSSYAARLGGNLGTGSDTLYGGIYMMQAWKFSNIGTHLQPTVASARFALVDPYI